MSVNRFSRRAALSGGIAATLALSRPLYAFQTTRRKVAVCIYGGTSGGVIAAVALAKRGWSVALIEPTRHLGGMTSSGLGLVDVGDEDTIGGLTAEFFSTIKQSYAAQSIDSDGWSVEPHVAESVFDSWVRKYRIEVIRVARLASVIKERRRIRAVVLDRAAPDSRGAPSAVATEPGFLRIDAAMFLDCSYEGDLLAMAGVSFRTDREGAKEYGEALAGVREATTSKGRLNIGQINPYLRRGDPTSGLLPLISRASLGTAGSRSSVTQPFNFRLCLTRTHPIPIAPPANYDPDRFEILRRLVQGYASISQPLWEGDLFHRFGHEDRYGPPRLCKITNLVNGKTDANNGGAISLDFVTGPASQYARATWAERARIWLDHEDYTRGFLYFLRTDDRMPKSIRSAIAPWGLPRDEFRDTGGWPHQLYIREARRMVSSFVITQSECESPQRTDEGVAFASYSLDSHICQRLARGGSVLHEGSFNEHIRKPYPLPYPIMVPRAEECENLLVTFCVSSTHVAFSSVRMEPPFMMMSESAALAADQALREKKTVQRVNIERLRDRLDEAGQVVPGYNLIDRARRLF